MDEIVPHLYLGSERSAEAIRGRENFRVIDCRGLLEPDRWGVDPEVLESIAIIINRYLSQGFDVLVHCQAGMDRSPLGVAYYLVRYNHVSNFDEAYDLLQSRRPRVNRWKDWIPAEVRAEMER